MLRYAMLCYTMLCCRVRLLNYVGMPVFVVGYHEVSLVPNQDWPVRAPVSVSGGGAAPPALPLYWGLRLDAEAGRGEADRAGDRTAAFANNLRELISCVNVKASDTLKGDYIFLDPRPRRTQDTEAISSQNSGDRDGNIRKRKKAKQDKDVSAYLLAMDAELQGIASRPHA
jgi:hypothetical protein